MKAYKEGQYLVFKFEDGKDVRYNLSNGETIGKSGRLVKDICSQLSGYNLLQTIDSFEDERYRDFLKFIDRYKINKSCSYKYFGMRVDKVRNIGSFLSKIKDYSYFEQYFACGIKNLSPRITIPLKEVPKGLIKLCKKYNITMEDNLIICYKDNPDLFNNAFNLELNTINYKQIIELLVTNPYGITNNDTFKTLINDFSYNPISLIKYLDYLMTYEALDQLHNTLREFHDYCSMMSRISPKFEKYPKNFLTTHRIATRNYNRLKEFFEEEDFKARIDESLEYSNGKYKIIYPKSTQDIKDESVRQNHCVSSYIRRVINGENHILFLREKGLEDESLVTLEVKDYKVVQAKGRYNRDVTPHEKAMIDKYNKKLERMKKNVS